MNGCECNSSISIITEFIHSCSEGENASRCSWLKIMILNWNKWANLSVISGFCRRADENCALLGYHATSSGNSLLTFWDNLLVPSWGVENPKENPLTQYGIYTRKSVGGEKSRYHGANQWEKWEECNILLINR